MAVGDDAAEWSKLKYRVFWLFNYGVMTVIYAAVAISVASVALAGFAYYDRVTTFTLAIERAQTYVDTNCISAAETAFAKVQAECEERRLFLLGGTASMRAFRAIAEEYRAHNAGYLQWVIFNIIAQLRWFTLFAVLAMIIAAWLGIRFVRDRTASVSDRREAFLPTFIDGGGRHCAPCVTELPSASSVPRLSSGGGGAMLPLKYD